MRKIFPYLEVKGSYKDIGKAIGTKYRNKIQRSIITRKRKIPQYGSYLQKLSPYVEETQKAFPHLIEEAAATAQSADVAFLDYFFLNCREVYDSAELHDKKNIADHCTIAVSFGTNGAIVGHNEDWSLDALDDVYILKATINNTTFLGLQYATVIAGVAAAMNNWGLAQCINDLHQVSQIGVPKNFLARAILECQSLDQAEGLILKTKKASGFNHVLVQGNEVRNIEIAGDIIAVTKQTNKPFVHTNHYISPKMKHLERFHTKNSEARYGRAVELVRMNMKKENMIALLSDTQNSIYPICRSDETIGSLVLLPQQKEAYICYGHPCQGEYQRYIL